MSLIFCTNSDHKKKKREKQKKKKEGTGLSQGTGGSECHFLVFIFIAYILFAEVMRNQAIVPAKRGVRGLRGENPFKSLPSLPALSPHEGGEPRVAFPPAPIIDNHPLLSYKPIGRNSALLLPSSLFEGGFFSGVSVAGVAWASPRKAHGVPVLG